MAGGFRSQFKNLDESARKKRQVRHQQVEYKLRRGKAKAKTALESTSEQFNDIWKLSADLAYKNGYWLHTYATNFKENLFANEIEDALKSILDILDQPLTSIMDAVFPTEGDRQAYHLIKEEPNKIMDTFTKFNSALDKLGKSTSSSTGSETKDTITVNGEELVRTLIDKKVLEKETKVAMTKDGRIADPRLRGLLTIARKEGSARTINASNYQEIVENLSSLLTMQEEITKKFYREVQKKSSNADNKTFSYLVDLFNFGEKSTFYLEDLIEKLKSGQGLSKKLGFYFELAFLTAYGGTSTGTKKTQWTAEDVRLRKGSLMAGNVKLKDAVSVSLKRSDRIAREVNIDSLMDQYKEVEEHLRPIKYFLANYTLINEYQNDIEEVTFHDIPLMSIAEINELYIKIVNQLGQFVFTNTIVGYLLSNKPVEPQYLKDLPHLIVTANKNVYYTYELLQALRAHQNVKDVAFGDMMVSYTGGLASDYLAFTGHKKDAFRSVKANETQSKEYAGLLENSKVHNLYKSISKEMNQLVVWGVMNTATIMTRAQNYINKGGH